MNRHLWFPAAAALLAVLALLGQADTAQAKWFCCKNVWTPYI